MENDSQIPLLSIDDQVKVAERDKYIAEAEKAKAEKLRILLDYEEAQHEQKKKIFFTKGFRQQLIAVIFGGSILGFYINFLIVPAFETNNINLSLKNAEASKLLSVRKLKLDSDSVELKKNKEVLNKNISRLNSIEKLVDSQKVVISKLNITVDEIKKEYKALGIITANSHINQKQLYATKARIQNLDSTYNKQKAKLEVITTKTNNLQIIQSIVHFQPILNKQRISAVENIEIFPTMSFINNHLPLKSFKISDGISSTSLPSGNYYLIINDSKYTLDDDLKMIRFSVDGEQSDTYINIPLKANYSLKN